jgi:hypothetical protein
MVLPAVRFVDNGMYAQEKGLSTSTTTYVPGAKWRSIVGVHCSYWRKTLSLHCCKIVEKQSKNSLRRFKKVRLCSTELCMFKVAHCTSCAGA